MVRLFRAIPFVDNDLGVGAEIIWNRELGHFHKTCSDELEIFWTAVFLAFGCVSAQLQGCHETCAFAEALPKSEPDGPSKILAARRYVFSVNAPVPMGSVFSRQDFIWETELMSYFRSWRRCTSSLQRGYIALPPG
jgi:hypothetical protein